MDRFEHTLVIVFLIAIAGILAFAVLVSCGGEDRTYEGQVDAFIHAYGATTLYFHDGTTAVFQENVPFVIGDTYRIVVNDKHLKSLVHKGDE